LLGNPKSFARVATSRKTAPRTPPSHSKQGGRSAKRVSSHDTSEKPPAKKARKETGGKRESVRGKSESPRKGPKLATTSPKRITVVESFEMAAQHKESELFLSSADTKQEENRAENQKRQKKKSLQESKHDTVQESEVDEGHVEVKNSKSAQEASEKLEQPKSSFEEVEEIADHEEASNSELSQSGLPCDEEE
jgi:hypothetical protein